MFLQYMFWLHLTNTSLSHFHFQHNLKTQSKEYRVKEFSWNHSQKILQQVLLIRTKLKRKIFLLSKFSPENNRLTEFRNYTSAKLLMYSLTQISWKCRLSFVQSMKKSYFGVFTARHLIKWGSLWWQISVGTILCIDDLQGKCFDRWCRIVAS